METGLSIVQVVVVLAAMLGFAGSEGEESVRLSDEIRSVANIEKKWERGCLRWRKAKCRYRADVDTTAMIRAAHDFADTEWMHADSAVPLLLKFSRDRSIKAEKTHERLSAAASAFTGALGNGASLRTRTRMTSQAWQRNRNTSSRSNWFLRQTTPTSSPCATRRIPLIEGRSASGKIDMLSKMDENRALDRKGGPHDLFF